MNRFVCLAIVAFHALICQLRAANGLVIDASHEDNSSLSKITNNTTVKAFSNFVLDCEITLTFRPDKRSRFLKPVTVTGILHENYLREKIDSISLGEKFEGLSQDLLVYIASEIGFTYNLTLVADNAFGRKDHSLVGWNGIIGQVMSNKTDIAVAPLEITRERADVVHFTQPFMTASFSVLMKRPHSSLGLSHDDELHFKYTLLLQPFSVFLWGGILAAYLATSLATYVTVYLSNYGNEMRRKYESFTLFESFWFVFNSFTFRGTNRYPKSVASRLLIGSWYVFSLAASCLYLTQLFNIVSNDHTIYGKLTNFQVNRLRDLVQQTDMEFGVTTGSSAAKFLENSAHPTYSRMWSMIVNNARVFTESVAEGVNRVRDGDGSYAFIMETPSIEFVNSQLPCDTIRIQEEFGQVSYGIVSSEEITWRHHLDLAILKAKETGLIDRLVHKWLLGPGNCSIHDSSQMPEFESQMRSPRTWTAIDMKPMLGLFCVLSAVILVSIALAGLGAVFRKKETTYSSVEYVSDKHIRHH